MLARIPGLADALAGSPLVHTLTTDPRELALMIPIIALGGGLLVGALGIIAGTVRRVMQTRAREETKRELAAYVAEGSITPDQAERIIQADRPWKRGSSPDEA